MASLQMIMLLCPNIVLTAWSVVLRGDRLGWPVLLMGAGMAMMRMPVLVSRSELAASESRAVVWTLLVSDLWR